MDIKLQNLIFPKDKELKDHWMLFYQGNRGIIPQGEQIELRIPQYESADFYTYFNSCSLRKWKKYTMITSVKLVLEVTGACEITYAGYSLKLYQPEKEELAILQYTDSGKQKIEFEYPDCECDILGFEVRCLTNCVIHGGYYAGVVEDDVILNEVELAIATTTCRKEAFIKKNIQTLYSDLLCKGNDIKDHLTIHIIDNGRSLKPTDFPAHPKIKLHPNKNVGGSGGFARGMIEAMEQIPQATNVLLMDDDVLVEADSIYRTYILLKLLRPEYKTAFINGAMLYFEDKNCQHEDIGTISERAEFSPRKPRYCMTILRDILDNQRDFQDHPNQYGAWWFCCIPVKTIKEKGLPLPIFIRCDDAEYGLRCKPHFITMNGIGIWHMGFTAKYNASFDRYQTIRNLLVAKATTQVLQNVDIVGHFKRVFRTELLRFNYNSAELVIKAMEDYLKGPEFFMIDSGEKIMKENALLNETLYPLYDITDQFVDLGLVFIDTYRSHLNKFLFRLTYNGHRFIPLKMLNKTPVFIPFNHVYTPAKMCLRSTVISTNPDIRMGAVRTINKKRYKELKKRYRICMRKYNSQNPRIMQEYAEKKDYLTSIEFWKKYLFIK